jgi:hypothetical protein
MSILYLIGLAALIALIVWWVRRPPDEPDAWPEYSAAEWEEETTRRVAELAGKGRLDEFSRALEENDDAIRVRTREWVAERRRRR